VAVRQNAWIGVTQRSISSTAAGTSEGSAASAARWSGCSASASAPPETRLRVVSLPATIRVMQNSCTWASLSGTSPTCDVASSESRSSPGDSKRCRT
jgi:hypothetical protein